MSSIVENITKGEVFAVEYAGTMFIQDQPFYGAINVLDFDIIGRLQAESNSSLYVDAHNTANKSGKLPSELLAFKDYVHNRLDEMGVDKDPESEHKTQGCRIGGRLDILKKALDERNEFREMLKLCVDVLENPDSYDLVWKLKVKEKSSELIKKSEQ